MHFPGLPKVEKPPLPELISLRGGRRSLITGAVVPVDGGFLST